MPFEIVRNDMTKMKVDAVVNPTDSRLSGAGGLDMAIHRAAGPRLDAACRALGHLEPGEAKLTEGYDLPARYVIHTAGPVWQGGDRGEEALLKACYGNCLALAARQGCETVAFPLIAAGTFGYPKEKAMAVALDAIGRFLLENDATVYLVVFDRRETLAGKKLFREVQEYIDDVYAEQLIRGEYRREPRSRRLNLPRPDAALPRGLWEDSENAVPLAPATEQVSLGDLRDLLKKTDEGFSQALLRMIDERGMTDTECYKLANIDKRLFSKIRANPAYRPTRPTVFAFAMALRLDMAETSALLSRAGYAFTRSSKFDIVMEYFIRRRDYDIYRINEVLFDLDLPLLGSSARE